MKRLICILAAVALAACSTIQGQPAPTPAEVAVRVCPSLQMVTTVLAVHGTLDPALEADLAIASPIINTVCAGGLSVKLSDLHDLATKGLPPLIKIIDLMPIPDADKQGARIAIALTEAAIVPLIQPGIAP